MALQSSGAISLSDIQTEFGGSNPIAISEYYGSPGIPASGALSLGASFYGQSNITYMSATGGTVTTSGNYKYHTFTGSGSFIVSEGGNQGGFEVHLVGGGGGGGGGSGTAGAGGYTNTQTLSNASSGSYTVLVGGGGTGGQSWVNGSSASTGSEGIGSTISLGGSTLYSTANTLRSKGWGVDTSPASCGGTGGAGDGTHGGYGTGVSGGGANTGASDGNNAGPQGYVNNGNGLGQGTTTRDWGLASGTLRSGGGGGGAYTWGYYDGVPGTGGAGGGGAGAGSGGSGGAGTQNYGGGGGGAGWAGGSSGSSGGAGGSGIVIIRYLYQ